ncbi:MAG: hypothetical protein WBD25_08915 [Terriglobales bacterium]
MQMQISNIRRSLKSFQSFGILSGLLLAVFLFAIAATSSPATAQVVLSVAIAPPALPVYSQPICPGEGYIWTPGYWSYSDDGGYFWVPGTWVEAPEVGFLWTPGYWGWGNGAYVWNAGYWGTQVGFYGGIDYGFGYIGNGYAGGYWNGGNFFYNTSVSNVRGAGFRNVYSKAVVSHGSHVSFNGGHGGINARPTAAQETFAHERHTPASAAQQQHETAARADHNQFASVNHGHPTVAATAKPGEFKGAVAAKAASGRVAAKRTETKTADKARTERAASTSRAESKPRTEAKPEAKPVAHESKPAAKPRTEKAESTTRSESKPRTEAKAEAKPVIHEPKPTAARESKPPAQPRAEHESKPPAEHAAKPPAEHEAAPREEKKPPKS